MSGFENDIVFAKNADFTQADNQLVSESNGLASNGQFWIGTTAVNAGGTHVNVGTITSPLGTLSVGYSSPNLTLDLTGGATAIEKVALQTGTTPVTPTSGILTFNGAVVAAGTNPVRTDGTGLHTMALEVQICQAFASSVASRIGLASFDTAAFDVDANGWVQLNGGGIAVTSVTVDANTAPGTNPVVPSAAGAMTIEAAAVAAHSVPIETRSRAVNTFKIEVQEAAAVAATDITKSGISHFDSGSFSVDANGFVTLLGGTEAIDSIGVDATSGGGTNPVLPTAAGLVTVNGARVAAGTNPIRSVSTAANVYQIQVQTAQALAATDATKVGLANFSSSNFAVDANGFVTAAGSVATTYTGDSGASPAVPSSGNLNIVGLAGSQTSTSGSTVTIKSPPFVQVGASATSAKNTGEFVTAAVTRTLPASAGLIDGDLFIYVCTTAGALVIQSVTAQKIRIGTLICGTAGTATSTAIGDSLTLRFNATDGFFYATNVVGTWLLSA